MVSFKRGWLAEACAAMLVDVLMIQIGLPEHVTFLGKSRWRL